MNRCLLVLAVLGLVVPAMAGPGDTLVGDPFILGYNGWTDVSGTPNTGAAGPPNWGIHLRTGALQEASDGWVATGLTPSGNNADGKYTPYMMVNNSYQTPSEYTLSAQMASYDNDGFGVVFGYQPNGDYFRVGFRNQNPGSLGFGCGVSVQKVIGGVTTQIAAPNTGYIPPISTATTLSPVDVEVKVSGTNWGVYMSGSTTPIVSGTDADLAPGKVGALSWYQLQNSNSYPQWGTELRSVAVKTPAGAALWSDSFGTASQAAVSPVPWRNLTMPVPTGQTNQGAAGDYYGNFRLDFRTRTIVDDSNGYNGSTPAQPGINFTSPAIVVNSPGSANFGDYEMKTRLKCLDNDGIGVLVRVQDDDSFYRINFCSEVIGTGTWRAPQGLSIQKSDNGTWTELFRDDQANPLFVYTPDNPATVGTIEAVPFDVDVKVIGDKIYVRVIKDPDGNPIIIDYPVIQDLNNPLLTGTVGFENWGNGDAAYPATWGAFGGIAGTPLLTEVPEPATICLLALASGAIMASRRRRSRA